jgi:hypothetical protein
MEKHAQQRKQNIILGDQRQTVDWDNECTFKPPPAKRMPDFVRAQTHFQMLLDKKRSHKKPTVPVPFNFEGPKNVPQIHYLETDNRLILQDKETQLLKAKNQKNLEKMRENSKDFVPNATRAFTIKVENSKQERLKHNAKQLEKKRAQDERDRRMKEAGVKLRQTLALEEAEKHRKNVESGLADAQNNKKAQFQESTRTYQLKLKEINTKLESRPTVFQRCKHLVTLVDAGTEKKDKIAKMKMLLDMEETNKKNKVNIEKHLNPEQLNMLKDARLLRKMGKI